MKPRRPSRGRSDMAQMIVSGIALGAIYGLVALGIVLVFKATGVLNFAHGEAVMISTFVALSLVRLGLPYWLVVLGTLAFAALFGLAIERLIIRRFIGKSLLVSGIATLGLFLLFGDVAVWIWGKDPFDFPGPFSQAPINVWGVAISAADLGIVGTAAVLAGALFAFFRFTRLGVAMQASMENPVAAQLMGIPIRRVYALAWMLSHMIGAIAGLLIAPVTFLHFTMMQHVLHFAFASAVLGGVFSLPGSLLGGIIIGITANLTGFYVSSAWKEVVPFAVMLAILILKPHGLLAVRHVKKV
ncbi:MAG: branched-chain amino acid ABC transporter permease [Burkholderiales bacterium]|nr:MAG: branched-chain amino acid ABC transporter permease [Burkholderiales bacterium]